jgi:hypothetical protein
MYAKILNNTVVKYPYQWSDFEADNNNTNYGYSQPDILTIFPQTDIAKEGYSVVEVTSITQPSINFATQFISEETPVLINGIWTQNWVVTSLTTEQQSALTVNEAIKIRKQRDDKLSKCDWTQVSDCPLTNKAEWATYRQALRDLTKETGFPWTMAWPNDPNYVAPVEPTTP